MKQRVNGTKGPLQGEEELFSVSALASSKFSGWLGVSCLWLWRWTTRVYLYASLPFTTVNGSSPPELQLSTPVNQEGQ